MNKTPLLSPQQRVFPQEQEPPDELQASENNTPEAAFIKNKTQIETEENTQSSELTVRETEIQVENDILLSNLKIEVQDDTTDIEAIDSSSIIASDLALSDSSDATSPVNSSSSAAQSKSPFLAESIGNYNPHLGKSIGNYTPHLAQSIGNYTPPVYNSLSTVQDVEMLAEKQPASEGAVSTKRDDQSDTEQIDETDNDKQRDTEQTDGSDSDDNEGTGSFESDHDEKSHNEDDLKSEETNIHKSQEPDLKKNPIGEFSDELDKGNGEPADPANGGDGTKVQQVSGKMGDVSTLSSESQNIQENVVCSKFTGFMIFLFFPNEVCWLHNSQKLV